MTRKGEQGFTLVYLAIFMTGFVLFTGLAVDTGRAYIVKAQLSKAVDGAALGAARNLNGGDPEGQAARIFKANFPPGYMGTTTVTDPTTAADFFDSQVDQASGTNIVTVKATAKLPTTFMQIANFSELTVSSTGEATRRMVDLSLVLDVSSSIGPAWGAVRDAARMFIGSFDAQSDRLALVTFSNGSTVIDQMPSSRGFNKTQVTNDVPQNLPGGSTNTVEGMYRGWDELRTVPAGSQSGLRIIVLFTDGASNSVPGNWDGSGTAKSVRTYDYPQNPGDTNGQTWNSPHMVGMYDTQSGVQSSNFDIPWPYNSTAVPAGMPAWAQQLPLMSYHTHHRSSGIPTQFPLKTNALNVDGVPQDVARPLYDLAAGRYPSEIRNVNNAARNLVEIIANEARNDNGDYKIRIYTIGMGQLVPLLLGSRPEGGDTLLKRMSNDRRSPDFNANQLEGMYFYAQTAADVAPAFQGIQSQIVRLSK